MSRRIVITGATGLIGTHLFEKLKSVGYEVVIFSTNPIKAQQTFPDADGFAQFDYKSPDKWHRFIDSSFAVIHLAGAGLFEHRWNEERKKVFVESRVNTTEALVNVILNSSNRPKKFISSSAIGYYGNTRSEELHEDSLPGRDFLAKLCVDWEKASYPLLETEVDRNILRTGIVLSNDKGALPKMIAPYKFFVGGPLGNGKQVTSWIHYKDMVNIIYYLLTTDNCKSKVVNAVAPMPVTAQEMAVVIGKILHRPFLFHVPLPALRILYGEGSDYLLADQKVVPANLLKCEFKFEFEDIKAALQDLIKKQN